MKQVQLVIILLAVSALAMAQGAPGNAPAQQTPPAAQQPAQGPQQPGAAAPAPAPQQGKAQPQAKSEEEYKAYQEAAAKTTPDEAEVAANQFALKYPSSELRSLLYHRVMTLYQQANNADKMIEAGRKIISVDPNDPVALVTVATVLAERTRETDLDAEQRLDEAMKDAQKGLQTIETDLVIPPNTPPAAVENAKNTLRAMAYAAIGTVDFTRKNYAAAEQALRKATEIPSSEPDPYSWLKLSLVLDRQNKYQDALKAADKSLQS